MFEIRNLLFNITKHSYVPKHVLLSTTEAEEVYDKYSIKNKMFSCMVFDRMFYYKQHGF